MFTDIFFYSRSSFGGASKSHKFGSVCSGSEDDHGGRQNLTTTVARGTAADDERLVRDAVRLAVLENVLKTIVGRR